MLVDKGGVSLAGGEGMALPPLPQGEEHGEEVAAGLGEHVLLAAARRRGALGEDPVSGELAEAVGEDLTRGLVAFFLFASFGALWSGLSLPLSETPWQLSESQIGLLGIAGLAGALGAARSGRWADAGRAAPVTGLALTLLILSWAAIAQLSWSLWLLTVGIVVLDFAVQAVHVSNQHLLTAAHPDRLSSVIGSYMVFYSLGSAFGAAATTSVFTAYGWAGSSLLGAGFAACALAVWVTDRRPTRPAVGPSGDKAGSFAEGHRVGWPS